MTAPAVLPGSMKNTQPFKECSKCKKPSEPTGGVQFSATKWRCAACWRAFTFKK